MNHSDEKITAVSGFGLLLRLVTVLENLVGVAGEILICVRSGRVFGDPVWLTVDQAAERGMYSRNYIDKLIKQKRLYGHPQAFRGYRIFTKHFDLQMSRGFPVLDYQTDAEAATEALASRDVWQPAPVRPKAAGEAPRLKLKLGPEDMAAGLRLPGERRGRRRAGRPEPGNN